METKTVKTINDLATATLLAIWNTAIAGPDHDTVAKFSDRATAIARIQRVLTGQKRVLVVNDDLTWEVKDDQQATQAEPAPAPKADKPKKERAAPKPRGFRFVFPVKKDIKAHRENTQRALLIKLLQRQPGEAGEGHPGGATFDELMAATGWDQKTCYEGTRLLHYYLGYGMKQAEPGAPIFLVGSPTPKSAA